MPSGEGNGVPKRLRSFEAHTQVTGKRVIEGAINVNLLLKKPQHLSEEAAILIPDDAEEDDLVNVACPARVVNIVNIFIEGASMELSKLEALPKKSL